MKRFMIPALAITLFLAGCVPDLLSSSGFCYEAEHRTSGFGQPKTYLNVWSNASPSIKSYVAKQPSGRRIEADVRILPTWDSGLEDIAHAGYTNRMWLNVFDGNLEFAELAILVDGEWLEVPRCEGGPGRPTPPI